jgi:hypothetical protein
MKGEKHWHCNSCGNNNAKDIVYYVCVSAHAHVQMPIHIHLNVCFSLFFNACHFCSGWHVATGIPCCSDWWTECKMQQGNSIITQKVSSWEQGMYKDSLKVFDHLIHCMNIKYSQSYEGYLIQKTF